VAQSLFSSGKIQSAKFNQSLKLGQARRQCRRTWLEDERRFDLVEWRDFGRPASASIPSPLSRRIDTVWPDYLLLCVAVLLVIFQTPLIRSRLWKST
jgi:hypothetical protein